MIHRASLNKTILALCLLVAGCGGTPAPQTAPTQNDAFETALLAAERRVEAGDYSGADRILSDFGLKAQGTQESVEVAFFRALYMVDPNNRTASMAEGVRALDIYLNTAAARRYRSEALVLKRTAQTVLALRANQAATKVVGRDTVFVTRVDEIAALKDQLAKANAELERIKRRLANPSR